MYINYAVLLNLYFRDNNSNTFTIVSSGATRTFVYVINKTVG